MRECVSYGARRRYRTNRWRAWAVVFALAWPMPARAQTNQVEGHVVAVQGEDVIVDLAGLLGAADGSVIELWRPLTLRHPVTKKEVRDRFRIGVLRMRQVRDNLAIARSEGELERAPAVGDVVVMRVADEPQAPSQPAESPRAPERIAPTATCTTPSAAHCEQAASVGAMFETLRRAPLETRVLSYERWAREHPRSPYAATLQEEALLLRKLYVLERIQAESDRPHLVHASPATEALAAQPLTVGVELDGEVSGAVLHTRPRGEVGYASVGMKSLGRGYYSVVVPGKSMRAGALEYFIEATTPSGQAVEVLESAARPGVLEVRDQPEPKAPTPPQATFAAWTDYADYNRMRGNDVAWQTEGYFGMRFGDTGFRALRTGFGVFRGIGGSLEELDELGLSARNVGLTYGYLETEIAFVSAFSLILRGVVGLDAGGLTGGGQTMFRIGNDLATNLQLGGELLGGVGMRGIAQLELNVFPTFPMMVRTEVTNQPAGSEASAELVRPSTDGARPEETSLSSNDIGVRAIAQFGWRIVDPLVVAVRGSYQGRTIKHSGPGFGGAASYTW